MAKDSFTEEEHHRILGAIKEAEKDTSGEIRLFVEDHCKVDVLDRAALLFKELDMHKTEQRNGVLFYLAMVSRKFAVIGDAGIHSKVPPDFWDEIKNKMQAHFAEGRFVAGLSEGILQSGQALKKYFPHSSSDSNELPDDIVFGKD